VCGHLLDGIALGSGDLQRCWFSPKRQGDCDLPIAAGPLCLSEFDALEVDGSAASRTARISCRCIGRRW
jgi:hypothetical protein